MGRPKQLDHCQVNTLNVNSTMSALVVHSVDASGAYVSPGAGSTQVSIREILSSSGGSLIDSTNVSLGVTIRAGSAAGTEYTDGDVDATISGQAILFDNSSNTLRPVTSTRGFPVNIVAGSADVSTAAAPPSGSSGLVVRLASPFADSTNNAIRVFQVASSGGASSTEVTIRQSTYTDLGTLSRIADRDASTNVANVTNTTPASTAYALAVREVVAQSTTFNVSSLAGKVLVDQNSTVWPVQVSSVAGQVSVGEYSTTAPATGSTGLVVRQVGYSTTANVSSVAGRVLVDQNSTVWPVQVSSVAGKVLVDQNSTVWVAQVKLQDSSGVTASITNTTPSTSAQGLVVRPVVNGVQSTTVLITSTNSTAIYSLISSVAGARQKVFAYGVFSTHTNPSTLTFVSSNVIDRWSVGFGSGSSGITGANLAVSPPGWLFHTDAANALNVRIEGGSSATSTVIARISIAWWSEA